MASAGRIFLEACAAGERRDWEGRGDPLRALAPPEWRAVASYATRHGLAGLVARSLGWAEEATGYRAPIRGELDEARRGQLARHLVFKAAARRLADALGARQIPFITFKGVVLAEEVYGDLSLRRFQDFDAMVPVDRVDEAFEAARSLGYRLTQLDHVLEHVDAGAHAALLEHPDGTAFDLHWKLAPDMDMATSATVWRHSVPPGRNATFPGLRLSPAMTVVHLAKHFHMTQYGALKPLVDFHIASRKFAGSLEDGAIGAVARELGMPGMLDIVSALRDRSLGGASPRSTAERPRLVRSRVALSVLDERFLLDSPAHSRIGNWLRFLAASGSWRVTTASLREVLIPGRLPLVRFFRRPYRPDMYPRYYWRQLMKVFTLARK